jgi:hypothetical protein
MAFIKKGTTDIPSSGGDVTQKLDSSQLGKLTESGYQVTPVSNNPSTLSNTTPVTKTVMPGVTVSGFQDNGGNFFVVDQNNKVHDVKYFGNSLDNSNTDVPKTGGPLTGGPSFNNPISPPQVPYQPTAPLPPSNLGSGRIFTRFESGDIVPNQQEIITRALWSGNVGNLITFFTSSAQTATQQRYYYEVYQSQSGDCGATGQFAVAWGHKQGSGSGDEGGQINDTPSRAIYGQYKQLCLEPDQDRFIIDGTATDSIYAINVARARMREYLDEGNLEINLQRLSGSQWLTGGGVQNAWTGSNVKVYPTQAVTRLIDDSRVNSATITTAGEVYNIVSGTLEDGIYNSSSPHKYGLLYRRLGIIVLDGNKLDMSCSFLTVTGSEIPGNNAMKLFTAMSGAALYTDTSGDRLGFQGRSAEKVKSTHYFVRVKNQEYNFSNNPTFVTGSEGDLAEPTFIGDPKVYITGIGLYNDAKELLAVGKLSRPLQKSFSREALIKLKLEFVFAAILTAFNFI